ncbi:hypothetical protein EDB85DRAFT_1922524 [Lactarius pseudohatsudake]|nr:hypothetical protein EDB85DRAFT_1922524 [Lactarius pseudohatsudake]
MQNKPTTQINLPSGNRLARPPLLYSRRERFVLVLVDDNTVATIAVDSSLLPTALAIVGLGHVPTIMPLLLTPTLDKLRQQALPIDRAHLVALRALAHVRRAPATAEPRTLVLRVALPVVVVLWWLVVGVVWRHRRSAWRSAGTQLRV